MRTYPLFFTPVFQSRIWGGTKLQSWYPDCPASEAIGEAWILSDHPDGKTPVANGPCAGQTLSEVMAEEPGWFGMAAPFPLLFKVIDAASDLSVQVHPDDAYGLSHAGEQGKTECWWVLAADSGAEIVYGHTAKNREEFEVAVQSGNWDALLKRHQTAAGDFWFVPSGKLHALGAGTMVLEVQQSSNTTYRVYDYDRVDANGNKRDLHLEDALNVIGYPDTGMGSGQAAMAASLSGAESETGSRVLADCPYFTVEKWTSECVQNRDVDAVHVVAVAKGSGKLVDAQDGTVYDLKAGSIFLLPRTLRVQATGDMTLIATTVPR